ncbi:hypothetical protein [Rhizobacter fulvus]
MAYLFETAEQPGIFVARVGGERHEHIGENFSELWEFWSSVAAAMKQSGLHRLLAVISARGTLRSLDVPTFYRRLGEMGFMANMRLAVVFDVPEHDRPVLRLGVAAAVQDGWTIRQFLSEADAMEWL